MEALKTVVCTHELQGDTGQDFLCFCVAEMSQPVCVCVCVCECVRARVHVWVSSFVLACMSVASKCYRPDI